jgi:hypothetical protein
MDTKKSSLSIWLFVFLFVLGGSSETITGKLLGQDIVNTNGVIE